MSAEILETSKEGAQPGCIPSSSKQAYQVLELVPQWSQEASLQMVTATHLNPTRCQPPSPEEAHHYLQKRGTQLFVLSFHRSGPLPSWREIHPFL